jgi:hypothetical protein
MSQNALRLLVSATGDEIIFEDLEVNGQIPPLGLTML